MVENKDNFDLKIVIDTFHVFLEAFEEYIGKLNHYPHWENKRQIYRRSIADSNDTLEGFEDLFHTQLLIVAASTCRKTADFRQAIQKEYYKWIDATGIESDNCPDKLKHYLLEVNEVLEGHGEKIRKETQDYIKKNDIKWDLNDPKERDILRGIAGGIQSKLNHPRELKEVNIMGQAEAGKIKLEKIASAFSPQDRTNFHFYQGEYWNREPAGKKPVEKNDNVEGSDNDNNPKGSTNPPLAGNSSGLGTKVKWGIVFGAISIISVFVVFWLMQKKKKNSFQT